MEMFACYYGAFGESTKRCSYLVHKIVVTNLTIMLFAYSINAAEYRGTNFFSGPRLQELTDDGRFCLIESSLCCYRAQWSDYPSKWALTYT